MMKTEDLSNRYDRMICIEKYLPSSSATRDHWHSGDGIVSHFDLQAALVAAGHSSVVLQSSVYRPELVDVKEDGTRVYKHTRQVEVRPDQVIDDHGNVVSVGLLVPLRFLAPDSEMDLWKEEVMTNYVLFPPETETERKYYPQPDSFGRNEKVERKYRLTDILLGRLDNNPRKR